MQNDSMNIENALPRLIEVISHEMYHADYERTVKVQHFAYATATGDDIEEMITSVRTRETEEQKKQRIRITKTLTPVAVEMVKKYFRKLRKTDGVKVNERWQPENQTALAQYRALADQFYAMQSLDEYLFDLLEDYTFIDPNAFLVIERENIFQDNVAVGVRAYPIVFHAHQVRHYGYKYGVLDYLLTETKSMEPARHGMEQEVSEFRLYGAGFVLHAVEWKEARPDMPGYEPLSVPISGTSRSRNFLYAMFRNGTEEVPAIRLSAYLDGQTHSATAVTPMEPVKPLLEQLINIGSLHDLTIFLHSISRRKELVEACDYHDLETGHYCDGGLLPNDKVCPRCMGTGDKSIASEQDSIRIRLPQNFRPEDVPDLSKMAHTEQADVALLDWQQNKIDWLLKFIVYATMTRDAVTMAEISKTATEMVLNNQEAYNKIQPYAELYSQAYKLCARIITQYQGSFTGFLVDHRFPDDYQFETEKDLLQKLAEARANKAPFDYIAQINYQLIRLQKKSREEAERAKAWAAWMPWPDLSDEMLAMVLAERAPQDRDRFLRENFYRIRTEIERETGGLFYLLAPIRQEQLINEKVNEMVGQTQFRATAPADFDIENPLV